MLIISVQRSEILSKLARLQPLNLRENSQSDVEILLINCPSQLSNFTQISKALAFDFSTKEPIFNAILKSNL